MGTRSDNIQAVYPLTSVQEGMLFHALEEQGSNPYLVQFSCILETAINEEAFNRAWQDTIANHEALRASFAWEQMDRPLQVIHRHVLAQWSSYDWSRIRPVEQAEELSRFLEGDQQKGMDLRHAPLMRFALISLGSGRSRLVFTYHHLIMDGWSLNLVLQEVLDRYVAVLENRAYPVGQVAQFSEIIARAESHCPDDVEEYWTEYLRGFESPTNLRVPFSPDSADVRFGQTVKSIDPALTESLKSVARGARVTLNTMIQGAWALVVSRYSGESDVVFGATVSGRHTPIAGIESVVGLLINTIPVRVKVEPDECVGAWLRKLQKDQIRCQKHHSTPLAQIQRCSAIESGSPMFENILVFENLHPETETASGQLAFSDPEMHGHTNYPLTLIVEPGDKMSLIVQYRTDRFSSVQVSRLCGQIEQVLREFCASPDTRLDRIPMVTAEEREFLMGVAGPAIEAEFFPDTVHEAFEAQAARTPDGIALRFEQQSITYRELDDRANIVANMLRRSGVTAGALVAVYLERSVELVTALLGILKAGGAYVPIDISSPKLRTEFILKDTQAAFLITQKDLLASLPASPISLMLIDEALPIDEMDLQQARLLPKVDSDSLAYIIYTSGSTGNPKGVMIPHRNVLRLLSATDPWFRFGSNDVWTLFHSCAFDFSVWELWGALLKGGRLVVVPYWVSRSPESFLDLLITEAVTVLNQTPSAFRQLIEADGARERRSDLSLRYVIFGGEALELQSLQPWIQRYGDSRPKLINMYGITETTVHVTYRPISSEDLRTNSGSVIGKRIPDLEMYVLQADRQLAPIGVAGEICVGGAGVARGYLNRPELSTARFVPNPFGDGEGEVLYRSGDLARVLEDGDVEYVGRMDDQVKIRGFRIELGEVESQLVAHPAVKQGVVVARPNQEGGARLVAYFTVEQPHAVDSERLREWFMERVPTHAIPSAFVQLDRFPLTQNGKVDRKVLPEPAASPIHRQTEVREPQTAVERILCGIWSELLGLDSVSTGDNFFTLGGDSILAIRMISRLKRQGYQVSVKQLFESPTISGLGALARRDDRKRNDRSEFEVPSVLSPIQQWFFEQPLDRRNYWNQAYLFNLTGSVDLVKLTTGIAEVVERHDSFAFRFEYSDPTWRPMRSNNSGFTFGTIDLGKLSDAAFAAEVHRVSEIEQSSLNIESGPLVRFVVIRSSGRPDRLHIAAHHLAIDGVSWQILLEEIETAYHQLQAGQPSQLPIPDTSFASWTNHLAALADSHQLASAISHWRETRAKALEITKERKITKRSLESNARMIRCALDKATTEALLKSVPRAYNTQVNDILLTALVDALRASFGDRSFHLDLEGHGREDLGADVDITRTIGWFTALYPVVLSVCESGDVGRRIQHVKEQLRAIPDRGASYGILRYLKRTDALALPAAPILFNYLGQTDQLVSSSSLFQFSSESIAAVHHPENQRTHDLEVIGSVTDGALSFQIIYDEVSQSSSLVEALAGHLKDTLTEIVVHCASKSTVSYSPSDFPLATISQQELDTIVAQVPDIESIYRLAPLQSLYYSAEVNERGSGTDQWCYTLEGSVDGIKLRAAWSQVINSHEILRTSFSTDQLAEPHHIVHKQVVVPWTELDLRGGDEASIQRFLEADRQTPFDLTSAPLMRIALIHVSARRSVLVWSYHHLHIDGWSWPLVLSEVGSCYRALVSGGPAAVDGTIPYSTFLRWISIAEPDRVEQFWKQKVGTVTKPTLLPFRKGHKKSSRTDIGQKFSKVELRLSRSEAQSLEGFAREHQCTPSVLAYAAWSIVLAAAGNREDVVFGVASSGRPVELESVDRIIGPFVNNLPIRVLVEPHAEIAPWLRTVQEDVVNMIQYQQTPPQLIQECSGVPLRERLFDSLVVFQNYELHDAFDAFGEDLRIVDVTGEVRTNYRLTLVVHPDADWSLDLYGHQSEFDTEELKEILQSTADVLRAIGRCGGGSIAELKEFVGDAIKGSASQPELVGEHQFCVANGAGTPLEAELANLWCEGLGVDAVDVTHSWSDIGVQSVAIMKIHRLIKDRIAPDLPIVRMFEHSSIRTLAAYLSDESRTGSTFKELSARASQQRKAAGARRRARRQV